MPPKSSPSPPPDAPIAELPLWIMGGGWVRVACRCGRSVDVPTRMAAQRWPDLLLGDLVGRLRCGACGARPAQVSYADRADDWRAQGGLRSARRIWLVR